MNYIARHEEYVQTSIRNFGGVRFTKAPFDIIDNKGRFIEVKTVNKTMSKSQYYPVLTLSREEFKFALRKKIWYIFVLKGYVFFFPFSAVRERFLRAGWQKATPSKYGLRQVKRIYVPLKLLKAWVLEGNLGIPLPKPLDYIFPKKTHEVVCKQCGKKFSIANCEQNRKFCSWKCCSQWRKENGSWAKGKKFSEEHRRKISEAKKRQGEKVREVLDKI